MGRLAAHVVLSTAHSRALTVTMRLCSYGRVFVYSMSGSGVKLDTPYKLENRHCAPPQNNS